MTVHNFNTQYDTEHSPDNLPPYLQTTMIAQMLSIGGEGGWLRGFNIPGILYMLHNSNKYNLSFYFYYKTLIK